MKDVRNWGRLAGDALFAVSLALLFALSLAVLVAGVARADQKQDITLNAGEAFLIKGLDQGSTPEVRFTDNPGSFSVQSRSPTELLVLGVSRGKGTIRASLDGRVTTYNITVHAIANPSNPLAPGVSPPATSDSSHAAEGAKASVAKAETPAEPVPGTGPVHSEAVTPLATTGAAAVAPPPSSVAEPAEKTEVAGVAPPTTAGAEASPPAASPPPTTAGAEASPPATPPLPTTAGAEASPVAASSSPPVPPATNEYSAAPVAAIPSQSVTPPTPGQKYTTDPPVLQAPERETGPGGTHLLPGDALALRAGTSLVYDFPAAIKRVSIADSKIADIQVINPHQLMLVAHQPGFTSLVVWDSRGQYEEREVRVEKSGHQQVLLNAVVAEVNRTKIETEGIDISAALKDLGLTFAGLPGLVASAYTAQSKIGLSQGFMVPGAVDLPLGFSSNITYALSGQNQHVSTYTFFQFLENHDLGRVLAQPRLLANSGEEAKFLSGGEIPIVIAQALNTSVVFKQFGTSVVFVPTVIGRHDIELVVKPEVSKPDYSQGVQLFGFTVPAFVTRRAETDVRMQENQTLIIAGLILDDNRSTVKKVPYLGDVPYLGALFRNTYYDHNKTELVMSVTPQIVRPLPPEGEVAVPTEQGPMTREEIRTKPVDTDDPSRPRLY